MISGFPFVKMARGLTGNEYEEARKQRLEENKKKLEDLRLSAISKDLTGLATSAQKSPLRTPKLKAKAIVAVEPRRSSRERNGVPSYREDVGLELPSSRKRPRSSSLSCLSYIARPLEEIKVATNGERARALAVAEALKNNLQSINPLFVKSMVRSHVYSCFWLGLPSKFCEHYLPKTLHKMVLEDENGAEYEAVYIGSRAGLSGGWRAFALDHKLDDGDALVFELVEARRFKVYIVRAFPDSAENDGKQSSEEGAKFAIKAAPKASKKEKPESSKARKQKQVIQSEVIDLTSSDEDVPERIADKEVKSKKKAVSTSRAQGSVRKSQKKPEEKKEALVAAEKPKAAAKPKAQAKKAEESAAKENGVPSKFGLEKFAEIDLNKEPVEEETKSVSKAPRKKPAPKLFRKRA